MRLELQVTAFLVDDAVRQQLLPGARLPEQLLVAQRDEQVELALYVHPGVLATLQHQDPAVRLHGDNLPAYCIALEGVSHFVYLSWRAAAGWKTRALELELQAEVDKFVAAWLLLRRQGGANPGLETWLLRQCFGRFALHAAVPAAEHGRYYTASRAAAAFCAQLVAHHGVRHGRRMGEGPILQQVRRFCRNELRQKLA